MECSPFDSCTYVAYVDIKAAFDFIDREALWKALKATGVPPFLLHLVQDLHDGSLYRACWQRHLLSLPSAPPRCSPRLCLAQALFCCAIDWVLNRRRADLGIMAGEMSFTDLAHADDAALFAREPNK
ncbi:uncharacterized protein LOC117299136 [Asterias rubens]|uniref:uncharacterized protein LOC117299136 n=1 Tax=Asterias rubens TaxID=7604 RepID=UPI00145588B9|nr:uncharacterized protein LOC117299136 [Asterias rubens]